MNYINASRMLQPVAMRWAIPVLAALCAVMALPSAIGAAELFMYRRDGCPWCATWDREIGPIYPKTDIGRRVPLRIVDLDRNGASAVRTRGPVRFTPTFVLVDKGLEVGRIEGYPGDDFFWGLLERLEEKLRAQPNKGALIPQAILSARLEPMP
jgi:hypothetical protein